MGSMGKWIAAMALAIGFGSAASAQTLKVGSKNFTEQFIVAELYAAALEAASFKVERKICLLYTSPSPRDGLLSRMPSSA